MGPPRTLDATLAGLGGSLRPHRYVLPAAAAVLLVFGWMVTCGTGDLLDKESFAEFYDAQARSLLAGRWDVPRKDILDEAFLRDGKAYGYFGFAPALLHVPAAMLWPGTAGRWARLSETAACCVSLWYAYQLLLRARAAFKLGAGIDRRSKVVYGAWMVTLGLGSTLLFMAARAYVFHEAIVWGAALALGCYDHLCAYLASRRPLHLLAACALSFLAFFSRGSVGAGTLAALLLAAAYVLLPSPARGRASESGRASEPGRASGSNRRHAAVLLGSVALTVATFVTINYLKFRTFFDAAPLRLYAPMQSNPERLRRAGGRQISPGNVRTGARAYLSPAAIQFRPRFPWVYAVRSARVYPEARYDLIEPYAGLPAAMPAPFALAIVGVASVPVCLRRRRSGDGRVAGGGVTGGGVTGGRRGLWPLIPMAGAFVGGATTFAADALTYRYLHDFFPFLAVAGAFGVHALLLRDASAPSPRPAARPVILGLAVVAAVFGIWANFAIAIVYQRAIVGGVPGERRRNFKAWQDAIDHGVTSRLVRPLDPLSTEDEGPVRFAVECRMSGAASSGRRGG